MKTGDVVPPAGLMQGTEKQRNDLATLVALAQQRDLIEDDPEPEAGKPLGDDETDPEAEAALSPDGDGKGAPRGSQEPVGPATGVPEWFVMPQGLVLEQGTRVAFLRLEAKHTAKPRLGDRQCLLVTLTAKAEQLAYKRAEASGSGAGMIALHELAKGMIQVIDGERPDWARPGAKTNPSRFWDDIGPQYRQLITGWYTKTHVVTKEERAVFLASSLDDRVVG